MEVRCPSCGRFICEVPAGTSVRAYCRGCNLKFEPKLRVNPSGLPLATPARIIKGR